MKTNGMLLATLLSLFFLVPAICLGDNDSCGAGTTVNDVITTDASWDQLVSCTITLSGAHTHTCTVTACADAGSGISGTDNDYRFVVSTAAGGPGLDTAWERNFEISNNPDIDDPAPVAVCTVRSVTTAATSVTFYWLARKESASDSDMTVLDSSLGVVCTVGS